MGWAGPYPGRGPWRWLPPPLRPGWLFRGRGWCWWYWYYAQKGQLPPPPWPLPSKEDELKYLEELKKFVEERIAELRRELGK